MKIPVQNMSDKPLRVMLEPWTDTVDLASGQEAEITFQIDLDSDEIKIDFFEENFLSVWVPPNATIKVRS